MLLVHNHHVIVPATQDFFVFMPTRITETGTERNAYVQNGYLFNQNRIELDYTPRSIYFVEIYINQIRVLNYRYPTHDTNYIPFETYNLYGNVIVFNQNITGQYRVIVDRTSQPLAEMNPVEGARGLVINFINIQSYDYFTKRFMPARYASGNISLAANVNTVGWHNSAITTRVGDALYSEPIVIRQPAWGYVCPTSDRKSLLYVPRRNFQGYDCFVYTLMTQHGQIGPPKTISIKVFGEPLPPSLTLTADPMMVGEGSEYTVTLTTQSLPFDTSIAYTITGAGITSGDIGLPSLTGTFTIQDTGNGTIGSDSFTSTAFSDGITEGDETFTVTLDDYPGVSVSVIISDVTFDIQPNVTQVQEGDTVEFRLVTKGVADGAVFGYTIFGSNITTGDVIGSSLTGTFVINSNLGLAYRTITRDYIREGIEILNIRLNDFTFVSNSVSIIDTLFRLQPNTASIMRGESIRFDLIAPGAEPGRLVAYRLKPENSTVTYSELGWAASSGNFVLGMDGNSSVVFNTAIEIEQDLGGQFALELIEDTDIYSTNVILQDRTYVFSSNRANIGNITIGTISAESSITSVGIADASIYNGTQYIYISQRGYLLAVIHPTTMAFEAQHIVDTFGIGSGALLDILDDIPNGRIVALTAKNRISFDTNLRNWFTTNLGTTDNNVFLGPVGHVIIGIKNGTAAAFEAFSFTGSVNSGAYNITTSSYFGDFTEGESIQIQLATTGFINGAAIPFAVTGWTDNNNITSADFLPPLANIGPDSLDRTTTSLANVSGYFTVNNNQSQVIYRAALDNIFEGNLGERFDIELIRRPVVPNYNSQIYTVYIKDPGATYLVTPSSATVDEGNALSFIVTTTSVADNTVLYYKITNIEYKDWVVNSAPLSTTVVHANAAAYAESVNRFYWIYFGRYADQEGLDFWVGGLVNGTQTINQVQSFFIGSAESVSANGNVRTGTVTISNNSGLIDGFAVADNLTEGNQTLLITIHTGNTSGPVVASNSAIIIDTSLSPSYQLTPNVAEMDEGQTVRFVANTTNLFNYTLLFWSVGTQVGNITLEDFAPQVTSGNVVIVNNTGFFDLTLALDQTTEWSPSTELGYEIFQANLYTDIARTQLVASAPVKVWDISRYAPTYSIVPRSLVLTEGETVVWDVTTNNIINGTTLYWTNNGSSVAADFNDNVNNGFVVINSNQGVITRVTLADTVVEELEWINLELRTSSVSGNIVATSVPVRLRALPTYTVTVDSNIKNEGDSVTFFVTTTAVDDNTMVWYSVLGANVESRDMTFGTQMYADTTGLSATEAALAANLSVTVNNFYNKYLGRYAVQSEINYWVLPVVNALTTIENVEISIATSAESTSYVSGTRSQGSLIIMNGAAIISGQTVRDDRTEGPEIGIFTLYNNESLSSANAVANVSVTIQDTSLTPPATYSIQPNVMVVNEGQSIQYTISSTNAPNGTLVYVRNFGTAGTLTDFTANNPLAAFTNSDPFFYYGRITIVNNSATFVITAKSDTLTEETEWVNVSVISDSPVGNIVANSAPVMIMDTSKTPAGYVLTANVAPGSYLNWGDTVRFTANTTSLPDGAQVNYRVVNLNANELVQPLIGTFTITNSDYINGSGTFDVTTIFVPGRPGGTNHWVSVYLQVNGINVGNSFTFYIETIAQWFITTTATTVGEGSQTVSFSIEIQAFENELDTSSTGTFNFIDIYWRNLGSATAADITYSGLNVNAGVVRLSRVSAGGGLYYNRWTGTLTLVTVPDFVTEGAETIQVALYENDLSPLAQTTSNTVIITDNYTTQSVILTVNTNSPDETVSRSITVNIYTLTSFPAGVFLYWDLTGDVNASDFSLGTTTGSYRPKSTSYTSDLPGYDLYRVFFTVRADITTEGAENAIFNVRLGANPNLYPPIAGSGVTLFTIEDTSRTRTLTITTNKLVYDEGESITITITGSNWDIGRRFALSSKGISAGFADSYEFLSSSPEAYGDLDNFTNYGYTVGTLGNWSYSFPSIIILASITQPPEGDETFYFQLHNWGSIDVYDAAIQSTALATGSVITIRDSAFRYTASPILLQYSVTGYSTGGRTATNIAVLESAAGFDSVVTVFYSIASFPAGNTLYWYSVDGSASFLGTRDVTNYDVQSQNGGGTLVYTPAPDGFASFRLLIKVSTSNAARSFRVGFSPYLNPATDALRSFYGKSSLIQIQAQ